MDKRKVLLVHPGHSYSTHDVFLGLEDGLRAAGCQVQPYHLQVRIGRAASWLYYNWRRVKREHPEVEKPNKYDVIYQASIGVVELALRELPDWVIAVSGSAVHPDALIMLRRAGAPLAILFTESPYEDEQQAGLLERLAAEPSGAPLVAYTNERTSVPFLRAAWPAVEYLPHAYDPDRHYPADFAQDDETPAHEVVFVGSAFPERVALLSAVDWTGIDFALYGEWSRVLPSRHPLRRYIRSGPIDNRQAANLYRRAKIGLNLYRQSVSTTPGSRRFIGGVSLNPRAYELAACGAFHLSEARPEVTAVFGETVPTFTSAGELSALVRYYLSDSEVRERYARALPERVAGQTWRRRAREMLERLPVPTQPPTPALAGVF